MALFDSKPKVAPYVAPAGPITMDRTQFINTVRPRPIYRQYSQVVGLLPAGTAFDNAFTESLRAMGADGFWHFGTNANFGNPIALRFPDAAGLNFFMTAIEGMFEMDLKLIERRAAYANGLKGKAGSKLLLPQLRAETQSEDSYYQAPPPVAPKPGVPAVPPRSERSLDQARGLAWLTNGVQGDASAYSQVLLGLVKRDGSFPLGGNLAPLQAAWQRMVPLAPAYRGWNNAAGMQKYPSNVGGAKVLGDVLSDLSTSPMPAQGSDDWYELALYLMGSIITAQAFTDGNKRAARLAYVLMLLSGGVPMIVPNNRLGATLGDM